MSTVEFMTSFDQIKRRLVAFACSLTGNQEDANDLYQETVYRAYKNKDRFIPGTNLNAWVMTIMRNIFINDYRRKKRYQTVNQPIEAEYVWSDSAATISNLGESSVTTEELYNLIDQLDDKLKIPFLMHFEGYKYNEIADHFQLPIGTIKSRIFFARKKLQRGVRDRFSYLSVQEMLN